MDKALGLGNHHVKSTSRHGLSKLQSEDRKDLFPNTYV